MKSELQPDCPPAGLADAYFCVPIDDGRVRSALARAGQNLPPANPNKYHLTLRYLKSVDQPAANALVELGRQVCRRQQPFALRLGRPGRFDQPPVDWYGLAASPGLMRLQADLGRAVLELGYPPADYDYNPHITLGRSQPAVAVLETDPVSWTVSAIEFRRAGSSPAPKPPPVRLPFGPAE